MIVVDASVILEVLLNTAKAPSLRERLVKKPEILSAPHLIDLEVLQILRRSILVKDISDRDGALAFEDFKLFVIERYPHDFLRDTIWSLRGNFTAYDAAYVALTLHLKAKLLTCDGKMAKAAKRFIKVEVY